MLSSRHCHNGIHKILFHGRDIIEACILPIGQYSEEAQEAGNKNNRQYRELFTRKTTRTDTNTDLLNRLLITSDPSVASFHLHCRNYTLCPSWNYILASWKV